MVFQLFQCSETLSWLAERGSVESAVSMYLVLSGEGRATGRAESGKGGSVESAVSMYLVLSGEGRETGDQSQGTSQVTGLHLHTTGIQLLIVSTCTYLVVV